MADEALLGGERVVPVPGDVAAMPAAAAHTPSAAITPAAPTVRGCVGRRARWWYGESASNALGQ